MRADNVQKMVDFFRNFADRCHHAKEEKELFPRMQQRGMSDESGPIAVMLMEHDEGRRKVAAIAEALARSRSDMKPPITLVKGKLLAYVELLKAHIEKEDNILYPLANRILGPEDQQALAEAFERVEAEEIGEGVHEKYHQLAHELSES